MTLAAASPPRMNQLCDIGGKDGDAPHHPRPATGMTTLRGIHLTCAATALTALAALALHDGGAILLLADEPLQRFVESQRNSVLNAWFMAVAALADTPAALAFTGAAVTATWRRCRGVALAVLVVGLIRPVVEASLKLLVGRERPQTDPLVGSEAHAFPSGHVLAAIALWGLLPMIVATFTRRPALLRTATVVAVTMVTAISISRVYLGVHWMSDVVAAWLVGAGLLAVAHTVWTRCHRHGPCHVRSRTATR